jgi:DNA-binding transcriptional regulator/RsmH inhibitor MraZ
MMDDVDTQYWDELRVNYEKIDELQPESALGTLLRSLKKSERKDLCNIMKLINLDIESDDIFLDKVLTVPSTKYLLYLREFLNRKKKAVDDLYSWNFSSSQECYESSDFIKLVHMYYSSPAKLFEILVLHEWKSKSTGDLFQCDKNFLKKHLESIAADVNFQRTIVDTLYKEAGQETDYKLLAHCKVTDDHYIYMIYKLNKDTKRVDFDRAKRIKDVDVILMSITLNKKIVEIKSNTKTEIWGLKKYIQEHIGSQLGDIVEEVYTDYEPTRVSQVFKGGEAFSGHEPEDFVINKMVFSNSLLIKSPEIVIQFPKSDVWLSVVDAFKKKVVDINSLRDINQIKFTANNHSRIVRSVVLENGNVIFKLDDSGIDEDIKKAISEKFINKFGFPLNQPVENKFTYGEAAQIDYLISLSTQMKLSEDLQRKFDDLKSRNIIQEKVYTLYKCQESSCGYQSINEEDFLNGQCSKCKGEEFITSRTVEYSSDEIVIKNIVENCFLNYSTHTTDFVQLKDVKINIKGKEYVLNRFKYKEKPYQVLVIGNILSKNAIEQIERQLIPTIIIYYGIDKEQAGMFTPNTIEYMDFGLLYLNQHIEDFRKIITPVIETLEERASLHIITVATKALTSLRKLIGKTEELNGEYDEDIFEDEVYPILKDMIPNSEKWGNELRGKPVPEGLLAIQFNKEEGIKSLKHSHVFTYDCKFTTDKTGYDLNSGEKRKGIDYVKRLNRLREISSYCTTGQISAHIFISNKFKPKQIQSMAEYFYSELGADYKVKPVFIEVDVLVYLYSFYNKNKEKIMKVPDVFYEQLYLLLTPDSYQVTTEMVDEYLDEVLYAADQYIEADTARITQKLIKS